MSANKITVSQTTSEGRLWAFCFKRCYENCSILVRIMLCCVKIACWKAEKLFNDMVEGMISALSKYPSRAIVNLITSIKYLIQANNIFCSRLFILMALFYSSIYGIFFQTTPIYLIRDPEILRKITVKEFDHFMNHRDFFGDSPYDLFSNSLIQLKDDKWKDMRSTLSPAFTGSRLRQMFELINQVAEDSAKYLQQLQSEGDGEGVELELKDYATRFATDVIASTAFGLQVNSFENKDNKFFMLGKKATTFNWRMNLRFTLFIHFKGLMKVSTY